MKPTIASHKFLQETISLKSTIEESFLHLAERLYKIKTERLWETEYETLDLFLLQLDLSQGTYSKLCSVYEHWVLKAGVKLEVLAGSSWTSLYSSIPLLETQDANDLADELKLITRQDVVEKAREAKNGTCERHQWVAIRFCSKCGKKEKTYEN
jgi:hypothetical protein